MASSCTLHQLVALRKPINIQGNAHFHKMKGPSVWILQYLLTDMNVQLWMSSNVHSLSWGINVWKCQTSIKSVFQNAASSLSWKGRFKKDSKLMTHELQEMMERMHKKRIIKCKWMVCCAGWHWLLFVAARVSFYMLECSSCQSLDDITVVACFRWHHFFSLMASLCLMMSHEYLSSFRVSDTIGSNIGSNSFFVCFSICKCCVLHHL